MGNRGGLGSFIGCSTWYEKGIMAFDYCFYFTKYSTDTAGTKKKEIADACVT